MGAVLARLEAIWSRLETLLGLPEGPNPKWGWPTCVDGCGVAPGGGRGGDIRMQHSTICGNYALIGYIGYVALRRSPENAAAQHVTLRTWSPWACAASANPLE
eukprot:3766795-Pyramimonas_sp.AAC.1